MVKMESEQRQWNYRVGEQEETHTAYLITDQNTEDLFQAVSHLLEALNCGGIQPLPPEKYRHVDMRYAQALGLSEEYRFVALKDEAKVRLLLFSPMTVTEYICSKTPSGSILEVSSGSKPHKTALEIFHVELAEDTDLIHGSIQKQGDQWVVNSVFDKAGWGFDEYKEKLRELGCLVIDDV